MVSASAPLVHLNNAGSALPSAQTLRVQIEHLQAEATIGGYEAHAAQADAIGGVSASVAQLLNTTPEQVALVESATVGWDRALQAVFYSDPPAAHQRILVASTEYASNVLPLMQVANRTGASVEFIPDGPDGSTSLEALKDMLDENVWLISITHAPSHNGVVNDVVGVGDALRFSGSSAWNLVDACQSVGQLPVDFARIGADAVSATGRKFLRGPRGTGFVAVSHRLLHDVEPFPLDLHAATWTGRDTYEIQPTARRFESWETSYSAVLGLGAAVDQALDLGIDVIAASISALAEQLRVGLASIPGITVQDRGTHQSGIVTITVPDPGAAAMVVALREHGINTSLSTADYAPIDFSARSITEQVRLSPHTYLDAADIDRTLAVIAELVGSRSKS